MLTYLDRYLIAQDAYYAQALQEIRNGRKESHWIWFIFPQIQGLGSSANSVYYAIPDLETAREYLAHPVLGARLQEVCQALLDRPEWSIHSIFPYPDNLKVQSCMTLFALTGEDAGIFQLVLAKYFQGERCENTLKILRSLNIRKQLEPVTKPAFCVIGLEGSTEDGPGFIPALWEKANARYAEVAHLAKLDGFDQPLGFWGAMTDMSRSFQPWEDGFTRGLYLAGVEVEDDAEPPAGWTKWRIPGFLYMRVASDLPEVFPRTLAALEQQDTPLAGAVQDYIDPSTGRSYMLFPIRKL